MNTVRKSETNKLKRTHLYYKYTGFYSFVGQSLKKSIIPILAVVGVLILLNAYVIDFGAFFTYVTENYAPLNILIVFLASESLLGLVPPEIFIAWSHKMPQPILYLSLLALLSYIGGIISYFIGRWIFTIPKVYAYLEGSMKKHLKHIRKWGGFLIVVGALLPIPYSMTSMAAGMIQYKFTNYLMFGLLRFVRFYLYALAIFNLV
ncbi:YqaA family protein [Aequorivita viscosa]|uniref:Membrane protein YqaA, SNARE-associated domain n=1 Tax=Aequorivita viscosa TaxID=797419 RepID=A0A1M6MZH3_9FLAO|nr:VTT domain-containing protein [Aequorivita viscosa]SDX39827.1 membrane protein YqaA, SNARE-associated domain [Aequorivita viscosa]SHJ88905.1 membrane protein YqaA, SNARE-associated domain [Aequorivita viscosa]